MRRFSQVISTLFAVAILTGTGWLIVRGVEKEPALVGSLLTAASAVAAVAVSRTMDRRAEQRQTRRDQIAPIYAELIERLRAAMDEQDPAESERFWKALATKFILNAPDSVIEAQLQLGHHFGQRGFSPQPDAQSMLLLERLYRAIRADLGHNDRNMPVGNLLRLYITDVDELIGPFTPRT